MTNFGAPLPRIKIIWKTRKVDPLLDAQR